MKSLLYAITVLGVVACFAFFAFTGESYADPRSNETYSQGAGTTAESSAYSLQTPVKTEQGELFTESTQPEPMGTCPQQFPFTPDDQFDSEYDCYYYG